VITGGHLAAGNEVLLAPDAALPVVVDVPTPPWSLFPRHDKVDVNLTVTGQGRWHPEAALSQWAIEPARRDMSASVRVTVNRTYGLSPIGAFAVLLATFVGGGLLSVFVRGKLMPLRLGGDIAVRYRTSPRQSLPVAERAEVALVLGDDGVSRIGSAEESTIILRVRRPLWNLYAEVQIRAKGAEINGRPAEPGTHKIIPGATSIRVGDWRVSWE
jgi:hypothetical protein